jgi:hypothetical protein
VTESSAFGAGVEIERVGTGTLGVGRDDDGDAP